MLRSLTLLALAAFLPQTPDVTLPPATTHVRLVAEGRGTQVYACTVKDNAFVWVFHEPQASLFDPKNHQPVGTHTAGPTWTWNDGSAITGKVLQTKPSPDPAAIPWLLLETHSSGMPGALADITYVRLDEAFVYLAVVLDAFSRKAIGWALADHLRASLALDALQMALASRPIVAGALVHHSDRGTQYACEDYIDRLEAAGIQPSMSRAGCPYDNAMAESFMKTLKHEEVDGGDYRDIDHVRSAIGSFIDEVYNRQRLHSALDYRSPTEFEANWLSPAARKAITSTEANCP